MSSVEHTNASHFNCMPFSKVTNEANGTNMRWYERSKKVIQISLICSSNYHMTPIIKDTSNQHSDTEKVRLYINQTLAIT